MDNSGAAWGGGQAKGPKIRVCYVCGRGYGLSSYEIHLKQCKAMWEAKQEGLPSSERKPLPSQPEVGEQMGGGPELLDAQNEAATQVFNTESLAACENCGRTFLEERLKIHQKSCTTSSPAKPVGAARLSSTAPETAPVTTATPKHQTSSRLNKTKTKTKTAPSTGNQDTSAAWSTGSNGVQEGTSTPLAGNYGGIARRGSRGLRASQTPKSPTSSEESAIEILEKRLVHVEKELVDTKTEVGELRRLVKTLQAQGT